MERGGEMFDDRSDEGGEVIPTKWYKKITNIISL
jgi:hypothetical protein